MSETRTSLTPRDVRCKAFALLKKCWLPVLIAVVVMNLFTFAQFPVTEVFTRRGAAAYQACLDEFYAARGERPPADPDEALDYDLLLGTTEYDAYQAYERITEKGDLICRLLDLLGLMWEALIAVRLCRGLLDALQGEPCTIHYLLSGWARVSTTCWMAVQRLLRKFVWTFLAACIFLGFGMFFDDWGLMIGAVPVVAVAVWAHLHYALAEVHQAADSTTFCSASSYLSLAVDDANRFGIWNMCWILWPTGLLLLAILLFAVVADALALPVLPAKIVASVLMIAAEMLLYPSLVCIYEEERQREYAEKNSAASAESLARLMALKDDANA